MSSDLTDLSIVQVPTDARCIKCGYLLRDLPHAVCPECGEAFDPNNPHSFVTGTLRSRLLASWNRHRTRVFFVLKLSISLAISWWLYSNGSSSVFWVPGAFLLYRRQWALAASFALACPLSIAFAGECLDYASGGWNFVRYEGSIIETPQGSADPRTRIAGHDPGCGNHEENYQWKMLARNIAITVMHGLIGPPPGAYTGPYPDLATCQEALALLGQKQNETVMETGLIVVGLNAVQMNPMQIGHYGYVVTKPDSSPITAVIYQKRCLILRVPRDSQPKLASIILADAVTGRAFAVYWEQ